jgi:nitroreductase
MNLLWAANGSGWSASWVAEWYSFSATVSQHFKLKQHEKFAGFIYIGTAQAEIPERQRPDSGAKTLYWQADS